jgi:hypothetical protein
MFPRRLIADCAQSLSETGGLPVNLNGHFRCAVVAVAFGFAAAASAPSVAAEAANGLSAYVGRWQMNAAKTKMGRLGPNGPNIARSPTFTWTFTSDGPGLRMEVYNEYPQPAPTRTMTLIADGKQRTCDPKNKGACLTTGGKADEQVYAYFMMDSHMLARLFYDKGKVVEYSTYAVSTDGKTLSIVSWSPETPEWHNIQVFDRQP